MTAPKHGRPPSTRVRLVVSLLAATVAILAPLAWLWQSSLVGKSYSVMGMGYLDYGGGPVGGHDHGSQARSITDLVVDPARKADVRVDLVAEQQNLNIGGRVCARLHPERHLTWPDDHRTPGPAGRGASAQRLCQGRHHVALARI